MTAVVLGPGEGTRYLLRGSEIIFKAAGAETGGVFSFLERQMPPSGRMTPPHRHAGPEAFFVLDGSLEFRVEDEIFHGSAGTFVLVPEGAAHTFGNTAADAARLLTIHAPAADGYFAAMHELWSAPEPPTVEQEREVQRRNGIEPA